MNPKNRRSFLKVFSSGLTGAMLLPSLTSSATTVHSQLKSPQDNSEAYWQEVKEQFKFASGLHYFNNASLGPSPIPVQEATELYRETLDGFPSKYMWGGWQEEKEAVRDKLAGLFACSAEEIALIHNTTEGMNLIARSFDLQPGDEVILIDHEHASGTIPWEYWQESKGIKLVRPVLPILPDNEEEVVELYRQAITPNTKIISMCHIVNTNGMILPVKKVSEMAHEHGILVAVDGAQSSGMLNIDLPDLGCDFYTASSHKWLFSPKGVGVLYARLDSQKYLKPLMVARGYKDKSIRRLETYNTRNLPEVLGLGAAVDFNTTIGSQKIQDRSYFLKAYFRNKAAENSMLILKSPASDNLSAAIQDVEIMGKDVRDVKQQLFDAYGIDTRPMRSFGLNALRISFAIYITKQDIDYLITALDELS